MSVIEVLLIIFAAYYLVINLIGFAIMGIDKRKAIKGAYRIPEATLFCVALLGGSLGTTLGMNLFRHKTKHWYFVVGMPLIFFAQLALMVLIGVEIFK